MTIEGQFLGVNQLNVESKEFEVEVNLENNSLIQSGRETEIVRMNALNVLKMEKEVQVG